jgi:NADPH-dependent 2,4-dienoyl-CoA reductase/sulfur reductase-like enzyme
MPYDRGSPIVWTVMTSRSSSSSSGPRAEVVIVGGGVAALEAALAVRALAG